MLWLKVMQVGRCKNITLLWVFLCEKSMFWENYYCLVWHSCEQNEIHLDLVYTFYTIIHWINCLVSKTKFTNWQAWSAKDFFVPCVHGGYEDLTMSLKMHLKILSGFQFSCIDFGCNFCIPETYILNVIMISAKIFQTCWITPPCWR